MEALANWDSVIKALLVVVAALELFNLVIKVRENAHTLKKPSASLEQRVANHEVMLANDKLRLDDLTGGQKVTVLALKALIGHELTGNGIDTLKTARDDIDKYLINRKS